MPDDPRQRREEGRKPCFAACITKPGHAGASLRTARHTLRPRRGTQHAALSLSKSSSPLTKSLLRDQPTPLAGGPVSRDDRLQHLAPALGGVDVAGTKRATLEVPELVEHLAPRCCRDPTGSTWGPIEVAGRPSV